MSTVASPSDVAVRLGRSLLPDEEAQLKARLQDAEAAIAVRLPGYLVSAGLDPVFRANLVAVTCDVALRAAGIPARLTEVVPAPGTFQEQADGRPGFISIRSEEWRRLGVFPMDVWNPYPSPFDDLPVLGDPGYLAGWGSWWPDCE